MAHLIGQPLTVEWFCYDADNVLTDCDDTPTVTVTGPGINREEVSTTNPQTGRYTSTYHPTDDGRFTFEFSGAIDAVADYQAQSRTVHDAVEEGQQRGFPYGLASWESAVS